jgi:hypothetical protein
MSLRYARAVTAALLSLLLWSATPQGVRAQQESAPGSQPGSQQGSQPAATAMTVLTAPPGARVALHGASRLSGLSPLELPSGWNGRYSVRVGAPGFATAQLLLAVPSTGEAPYSLSEEPGLSPGLLFRSLSLPGVPDLSAGRTARGWVLVGAAVVGGAGAARAEKLHSRDLKAGDSEAADRAKDDRIYRNRWLGYVGTVWAMSALDYIARPRVTLLEATPNRVTLGIPRVTRAAMLWRSILVPGAGQEFAGQSVRGAAWMAATLACGAGFVIADFEYARDLTRLARGESDYLALDPMLRPTYLPTVRQLRKNSESSRKWRNGFVTATLGFYAINVLDALTVPIRRDDGTGEPRFTLAAPVTPEQAGLTLSYRF